MRCDRDCIIYSNLSLLLLPPFSRFPQMVQDEDSEVKKLQEYRERLKPMVTDTVLFMNKAIKENKKIVVEGANAAMLDIDFGTDYCVHILI